MTLILVATPLGNMGDLSPRAAEVLAGADAIACEDTRRTGRLLSLAGIRAPALLSVHEHNEASMVAPILSRLAAGESVALVTDAGMPAISDPGARVVRAAIDAGHDVSVVPGPSAAVAAVAISGLDAGRWVFEGFLPRKGSERTARLAAVAGEERTVVLYEAPHRLNATLADLASVCGAARSLVLVRELTKLHEEVWRGHLGSPPDAAPRGEYVIVLAGAVPRPEPTDEEITSALEAAGGDVGSVAAALAVPKRRVYALAVTNRDGGHVPRR